jgi:hypothetical protein
MERSPDMSVESHYIGVMFLKSEVFQAPPYLVSWVVRN